MSITYPDHIVADRPVPAHSVAATTPAVDSAPYTPVYARSGKTRNGRKAVKTWMILAPVGAVVLIGGGLAMAIGSGTSEPIGAPASMDPMPVTAPLVPDATTPMPATPALATPAPAEAVADVAPAPIARQAAEPRSQPAAVRPRVESAPVVAPVEVAPPSAGPQPYLSAAEPVEPVVTVAPAPTPPVLPPETVTGPPIN